MRELGGVAGYGRLREHATAREVRAAVADGRVIRVARGRYAVRRPADPLHVARACAGVVSHASAAMLHHWPVLREPDRVTLTVPRGRNVPARYRREADFRWADLTPRDRDGEVTSERRTVSDCLRGLPAAEALAIADSVVRSGVFTRDQLVAIVEAAPRHGRRRALDVATRADGRAATPFESAVRALSWQVGGLRLVPQVKVADHVTCDLVDESLRLVVECDSWTYHAERSAFHRDQERYNDLLLDGWLLLRFGLLHVLDRPEYVVRTLERAVTVRRTDGRSGRIPGLLGSVRATPTSVS